jgi:hypothetical protein
MPEDNDNDPRVWEMQLGIYATRQQAEQVKERITRLLCPDPDHTPPCPIPWSIALFEGPDDAYPELLEQARIEHRLR